MNAPAAAQSTPARRRGRRTRAALAALVASACLTVTTLVAPLAHAEPPVFQDKHCKAYTARETNEADTAWHVTRLRLDEAHRLATGKGITVAVIDTGVSRLGTSLLDSQRIDVRDELPADTVGPDGFYDCDHGTMVTSLIVGQSDRRTGFVGVAPDARIIAYRSLVASTGGDNDPDFLVKAVRDATARGVHVINISLSMPPNAAVGPLGAAISEALAKGIVVVAAAGNATDGRQQLSGPMYPAGYPGVISVGASNPGDGAWQNSYFDTALTVTVAAPGENVLGFHPSDPGQPATLENQAYFRDSGTSFAAPLVSGLVALLLERDIAEHGRITLTPAQVADRLTMTADPPAATGRDRQLGAGVINPVRALTGVALPPASPPPPEPPQRIPTVETPTPDPRPLQLGIAIAVASVSLTGVAVVLAIALPQARTRRFRAPERR